MNAFWLESLYIRFGSPAWFWPLVFVLLLILLLIGSSISPEVA